MNRRGFLGSILALAAAPAIVRADSLMRIVPRDLTLLLTPAERLAMNPLAWAGAIRRCSAYSLSADEVLTRFDVIVARPDGTREQLGVDIQEYVDHPRAEEMALAILKRRAAECGRPITGVLKLPFLAPEARFL